MAGVHVSEVVVVEHVSSVALDIIWPDRSLSPSVAASVSESVEGLQQCLELVSGVVLLGVGEAVVGDLCDQHVAFVPPGRCQSQQTQQEYELAHIF